MTVRDGVTEIAREINTPEVMDDTEKKLMARYEYKQMFTFALGVGQSTQPDKVLEMFDLIRKIKASNGTLTLENEEY